MSKRLYLTLSDQAVAILERRTTARGRGEFVTELILGHEKKLGDESLLREMDVRLLDVEKRLKKIEKR